MTERKTKPMTLPPTSYAETVEPEEYWSDEEVEAYNDRWDEDFAAGRTPLTTEEFARERGI